MAPIDSRRKRPRPRQSTVSLPAPTAWPVVLAFGVTLLFAGLVTSASVSILGAILAVTGMCGLVSDVLPQREGRDDPRRAEAAVVSHLAARNRKAAGSARAARALLPLEIISRVRRNQRGLAGGVAMAVLACLYGFLKQGSIWYPINLLAATVYSQSLQFGTISLSAFHLDSFFWRFLIHLITSLLVGLLYGAMLPMFPRRPILLGGIIAPILWTGLLHSILGLLNPLLNQLISWPWFIASQFAFGIVAGFVVVRSGRVCAPASLCRSSCAPVLRLRESWRKRPGKDGSR